MFGKRLTYPGRGCLRHVPRHLDAQLPRGPKGDESGAGLGFEGHLTRYTLNPNSVWEFGHFVHANDGCCGVPFCVWCGRREVQDCCMEFQHLSWVQQFFVGLDRLFSKWTRDLM